MKVVLDIKKNKAEALLSLLRDLPYVKIKEEPKPSVADSLREALKEVKLYEEGKIELQTLKEALDEL